jgi:N-acetylglucosaminyldiphosphoundecaprenol N-acetyl-beta-D-mannosaminyltransferase
MQYCTPSQNNESDTLIPPPAGKIFGIPIWGLRLQDFVRLARRLIKAKRKTLFTTIGAPSIVISQKCSDFFEHFQHADVVLPDGILPAWIARSFKYNVPERVPGPDFVDAFLPVAEAEGFKLFFLGATDETLMKLKANCLNKHPLLNIVGMLSPPFGEFDEQINCSLVSAINQKHPDVLFVGMTAPKQELWLSRNFDQLNILFAIGVGASFDYLAGNKPRVPKWLGRLGFEWLYRLVLEPKRLWRRNLNNIYVMWLLAKYHLTGTFRKHWRKR